MRPEQQRFWGHKTKLQPTDKSSMKSALLKRLLAAAGLDAETPPDAAGWASFLAAVDDDLKALDQIEDLKSSEELWRSLVQNLPDLICTLDLDGRITFSNRPMAGFTRQQVVGRPLAEFLDQGDADRVLSSLQLMLGRSQSVSLEARGKLLGTEPTWYSLRAALVQSDGHARGFVLVCSDIGLRKALQQDNERFRLLLDQSREVILVIDPDDCGRIIDFNAQTLRQLGYGRNELQSRRFLDLLDESDLTTEAEWKKRLAALKARGGQELRQGHFRAKDGQRIPVEVFYTLVAAGLATYVLIVALDTRDRWRMEEQLNVERAKAVFSTKMATLGEMAGSIAHEINNPVTIIDGYAQQLSVWIDQEPFDKGRAKVQAKKISDTALRIAKIVHGLRSFSRDGTHDPMISTDMRSIVDDTLQLCAERFRVADIKLIVGPNLAGLTFDCRATEMGQVLLNLLFNARDAVQDLPEKWVKIEAVDVADFIEISVTDSGHGIPEPVRGRIMQPFFTTKDVGQGTGLGLSISQSIVNAHGGRIFYDESSPRTRFVVVLPKRHGLKASA